MPGQLGMACACRVSAHSPLHLTHSNWFGAIFTGSMHRSLSDTHGVMAMGPRENKINVLFVIGQMEMGGAERLVHHIAGHLDRKLFNPSIAWFSGEHVLDEFKQLGIPLYHVPKVKRVDWSAMRAIGNIVKTNDIHIINAHNFMPLVYSFYGAKLANRVKLTYTEHSVWEIDRITSLWRSIGRCILSLSDAAIGVSAAVASGIQSVFKTPDSKTLSIVNGIDLQPFSRQAGLGLKEEIGISKGERAIGNVANFKRIKNHLLLLKGFNKVVQTYPNVKLLLIGDVFKGDEQVAKELEDYVRENGLQEKVVFLGYRSDIPELLSVMDVFCLTSYKEGLPISVMEAMAAGLPVVGTDVEGIRDVIIPGQFGLLVESGNADKLADALLLLLADEAMRHRMGQEAKRLACSRYSVDRVVTEYGDLFQRLVQK